MLIVTLVTDGSRDTVEHLDGTVQSFQLYSVTRWYVGLMIAMMLHPTVGTEYANTRLPTAYGDYQWIRNTSRRHRVARTCFNGKRESDNKAGSIRQSRAKQGVS